VENGLFKKLWTCRKTGCGGGDGVMMMMVMMMIMIDPTSK
jgi:hypothetical protein